MVLDDAYEFSLSFDGPKVERNAQNALTSSYLPAPHPISNSTLLSIITYLFHFSKMPSISKRGKIEASLEAQNSSRKVANFKSQ